MDEFNYAKGGVVPGGDLKDKVHRGEYVLSADQVREIAREELAEMLAEVANRGPYRD